MALDDLPRVTVTHRLEDEIGRPVLLEQVTIEIADRAWGSGESRGSIVPATVPAERTGDGSWRAELVPVNHPDLTPQGLAYRVTEHGEYGSGRPHQYYIAPLMAHVGQGPVDAFEVLAPKPAPGGGINYPPGHWDDILDRPDTFPPSAHTHPVADLSDSTALGRALATAADAGAARADLGITVDTSIGTRFMVGDMMIYGDIGGRNVTAESVATGGTLYVARAGQIVEVSAVDVVSGETGSHTLYQLPPGFRPARAANTIAREGNTATLGINVNISGHVRPLNAPSGYRLSFTFTFQTSNPWPTTLPGTPA